MGLAERYVRAYGKRDLDAMLAMMDEAVVFRPSPLFGTGRSYVGHDGVREWWAEMAGRGKRLDFVLSEFRQITSDRVAVLRALHSGASGRRITPWTGIMSIRKGQIVESRHYLTDVDVLEERGVFEEPLGAS
jgi:hypothetical protein